MKIGTAVQVLPLCHPLRLAEEVATVDQLSNGRLIFGVGRSGFAHTYKTYGVDYGESRERFAETLEIVKRAFTEERFSHKGKYYAYDNVRLAPRPVQTPWPEIRIAAASPDTYVEVGAMGHRSSSPPAPAISPSWRQGEGLSRGVEEGGPSRARARSSCACRSMSPRPRRPRARSRARASSTCCAHRRPPRRVGRRSWRARIENRAERGAKMVSIDYDEVLRERMIVGTPARWSIA